MVTLKGEHIFLRALEPEDLDFIYEIENNQDICHDCMSYPISFVFLLITHLSLFDSLI